VALHDWLQRVWYGSASGGWVLVPISWLFAVIAGLRRLLYRTGVLPAVRLDVPVIVIGNLTAGGTGKTPFTLWLAGRLRQHGLHAGIASRGYGRVRAGGARIVRCDDDPVQVGDEALMMARRDVGPVAVCERRVEAARVLAGQGVDVILCDDGLQHYALARDMEIAVIDGERRFGNGRLLPAGPLREPVARLQTVGWRICHGGEPGPEEIGMRVEGAVLRRLGQDVTALLSDFRGRRCHAVAAIGHPERFFATLRDAGIEVIPHPLPDHATPRLPALGVREGEVVLMTEKDAVKCLDGDRFDAWFLPVDARLDRGGEEIVDQVVRLCPKNQRRRG